MIILLPDREIELQDLENNFNWETLVDAPRSIDLDLELYLPKFKFEITIDLEDALCKVSIISEIHTILTAGKNINFSPTHTCRSA